MRRTAPHPRPGMHRTVCVAWWCLGEGTMYGPKKMIGLPVFRLYDKCVC